MSQRLRGEPPAKSNTPKFLAGAALVAAVALIANGAFGGDGNFASGVLEQAAQPSAPDKPTAKERKRAAERARRKRAKKGQVGEFDSARGSREILGKAGPVTTYAVVTEEATGVRPRQFAKAIDRAFGDPRSWIGPGEIRLQQAKDGEADVRIVLSTPPTVDELCLPFHTNGRFSCRLGNQLNINLDRWLRGTDSWPLSVRAYRDHVINHEMGHFLGFNHQGCPEKGALAPVMMQQTKGLEGCKANEWPYPKGGETLRPGVNEIDGPAA